MDSRNGSAKARERELDREIGHYKEAAVTALGQLEWIVGYLHKIRKPGIARALERNRRQIIDDAGFR